MKRPDKEIGKVLHSTESYPRRYQEVIAKYIKHLESQLQPRKTVSDAVDYYNGVWRLGEFKALNWRDSEGCWSWGSPVDGEYQVCTREQFEAEVERRKGEEWTHKFGKDLCYVKVSEPDAEGFVVIVTEQDGYLLCQPRELKPIKPSISLADIDAVKAWYAWLEDNDKSGLTSDLIEEYISEHEVK